MIKKHTYASPECEFELFRETTLLCTSTEFGAELDDLTDNNDNIEWDV